MNPLPPGPQGSDNALMPPHLRRFDIAIGGCWIWRSRSKQTGYATATSYKGKKGSPYRLLYEILIGPVPAGMDLDHVVCDNGSGGCANPFHCKPASRRENVIRTVTTIPGRHVIKTHCPQGHPYNEQNTRIETYRGTIERHCRICKQEHHRAHKERDPEEFNRKRRDHYRRNREKILVQKKAARERRKREAS